MKAILSNSTRKLLWFKIIKMLIAVLKSKFIVLFIIIFGTRPFPVVTVGLTFQLALEPTDI